MKSKLSVLINSIHLSSVVAATLFVVAGFVISGVAQRGPSVRVDAGKEVEFRLPFAFNPEGLRARVDPIGLVTITRNTDDEFVVTGQSSGEGLITVTGTRDGIDAAGRNVILPFQYFVPVRVLARRDIDVKTRPISVGKGADAAKTYDVGYIMQPGQEFYRLNERGVTWMGPVLVDGNNSIARGEVFLDRTASQYKLRITGIGDGMTTLKLLGERRVGNEWQRVERILSVKVGTGRPARPNDGEAVDKADAEPEEENTANQSREDGRNKIVDSIERYYDSIQYQVLQDNYNDAKAAQLLKSLEELIALIDQRIGEEVSLGSMDLSRKARLEKIKNKAMVDIQSLKNRLNRTSKQEEKNPLVGKWILFDNGRQAGEVRFVLNAPFIEIRKDSKYWLAMFAGSVNNPSRSIVIPADVQVRFGFDRQIIQLRGDAASGQLEFWATADLGASDIKKTQYTLVREDKLR